MSRRYSRRSMLRHAAAAGAAGSVPIELLAQAPEPYRNLTAAEGATLDAIVARLIPTDTAGAGAAEAGAARYIDLALGGWLADRLPGYRAGLAATDGLARRRHGRAFVSLDAREQDAILSVIEQDGDLADIDTPATAGASPDTDTDTSAGADSGAGADSADITSFPDSPASFFAMVIQHTIEGTFCDPAYGGNRDFVGWAMLGYPGIRLAVTAADQAMDAEPEPTGVSAYDLPMFDDPGGER